jgi:hypothetical protein
VVARDDRHLDGTRDVVEQRSRFVVLALEREIRDVAGDDDGIRMVESTCMSET